MCQKEQKIYLLYEITLFLNVGNSEKNLKHCASQLTWGINLAHGDAETCELDNDLKHFL